MLGQAQARGLITEPEIAEFPKWSDDKKRPILAQATKESVTAFQLQLMRQRKDQDASAAATPAPDGDVNLGTPALKQKIDQYVYLQDFPQTLEDFEALVEIGFTKLSSVNIIEELFNREVEDELDDITPEADRLAREEEIKQASASTEEIQEPKSVSEKLFNRMYERVRVFENGILVNRLLKTQP